MVLTALLLAMAPQTAEIHPTVHERIGAVGAPEEEAFGRVKDLAVSPDGLVYILDQQACEVRVFSPDGAFQFRFGKEGEGPGEFKTPTSIEVSGGEVLVQDFAGVASRFSLTGEHIESTRTTRSSKQGVFLGGGWYAALKAGSISLRSTRATESLLLIGPSSTDTLRIAHSAGLFVRFPTTSFALNSPFCGLLHYSPTPDGGLVVATGEDGILSEGRLSSDGWTWEESIRVAEKGIPLTDQDYDELLSLVPERFRPEATKDHLTTAPIRSGVCGLEVGTDGRLWLRLEDREGREYWVAHDPNSFQPVASFLAPDGLALKAFGSDTGFGVWKDDLGVDYVLVLDIGQTQVPSRLSKTEG